MNDDYRVMTRNQMSCPSPNPTLSLTLSQKSLRMKSKDLMI